MNFNFYNKITLSAWSLDCYNITVILLRFPVSLPWSRREGPTFCNVSCSGTCTRYAAEGTFDKVSVVSRGSRSRKSLRMSIKLRRAANWKVVDAHSIRRILLDVRPFWAPRWIPISECTLMRGYFAHRDPTYVSSSA